MYSRLVPQDIIFSKPFPIRLLSITEHRLGNYNNKIDVLGDINMKNRTATLSPLKKPVYSENVELYVIESFFDIIIRTCSD